MITPEGPSSARPVRVAAVDVGTNALRYVAAEFEAPRRWRVIDSERAPVRVGGRVFETGRIPEETLAAAAAAIARFHGRMDRLGIECYRAVATSAVREAENGGELVARAEGAGVRLEVIDGAEEARLGWLAIRSRVPLGERPWLAADLGGGSLELSLMDGAGVLWTESRPLGAVRLLEERHASGEDERSALEAFIRRHLPALGAPGTAEPARLIALGGNVEALAELAGARPDEAGVSALSRAALEELVGTLSALSAGERRERLGLRPDRADVILPGAVLYAHIARLAAAESLVVPHVGVKEGLLLDAAERAGTGSPG